MACPITYTHNCCELLPSTTPVFCSAASPSVSRRLKNERLPSSSSSFRVMYWQQLTATRQHQPPRNTRMLRTCARIGIVRCLLIPAFTCVIDAFEAIYSMSLTGQSVKGIPESGLIWLPNRLTPARGPQLVQLKIRQFARHPIPPDSER